MTSFSHQLKPSPIQVCTSVKSVCEQKKDDNNALTLAAAATMQKHTGHKIDATATKQLASEGEPYITSSDISKCKSRAYQIENNGVLRRFNRYREAMPYANAAEEMNELGDGGDSEKGRKRRQKKCLTMLPDNVKELNAKLGLPADTITDEDLRNDETGFRAALYRSESSGKLILVARDTQPDSLVDWKTNTDNGQGRDTKQYEAMRDLTGILKREGVDFDIAGYSKGGGFAQEAGLISDTSTVKVFNSAGLHESSLKRTGQSGFEDLASRTESFSSEGDFLTFMNDTTDPEQQLVNARFLRDELAGDGSGYNPMNIKFRNPEMKAKIGEMKKYNSREEWVAGKSRGTYIPDLMDHPDPDFSAAKEAYLADIDNMIAEAEEKLAKGEEFNLFPPVKANHKEALPNSIPFYNWKGKANNPNPNFAKQIQHLMSNVTDGLEKTIKKDKETLQNFVKKCG